MAAIASNPILQQDADNREFDLSKLQAGARARVSRVLGETADTLRLKALGLCEGREVEVLRTGEALVVRVLGSRIGLSRRAAASVLMVAA